MGNVDTRVPAIFSCSEAVSRRKPHAAFTAVRPGSDLAHTAELHLQATHPVDRQDQVEVATTVALPRILLKASAPVSPEAGTRYLLATLFRAVLEPPNRPARQKAAILTRQIDPDEALSYSHSAHPRVADLRHRRDLTPFWRFQASTYKPLATRRASDTSGFRLHQLLIQQSAATCLPPHSPPCRSSSAQKYKHCAR